MVSTACSSSAVANHHSDNDITPATVSLTMPSPKQKSFTTIAEDTGEQSDRSGSQTSSLALSLAGRMNQ